MIDAINGLSLLQNNRPHRPGLPPPYYCKPATCKLSWELVATLLKCVGESVLAKKVACFVIRFCNRELPDVADYIAQIHMISIREV